MVNIQRKRKAKAKEDIQERPKKLAIAAESDQDTFDYITTPKCLACDGKELPRTDKLEGVINAVLRSMSSSQQSEVKAWEEEIVACDHTRTLKQLGDAFQLEAAGLAKCSQCELDSNLWLCLTCGNLGCGRAQFGGTGGNSHGLTHFETSGHPVCVKQGTITAEGTADIYCYACNDARIDPQLATHLAHFGINVMDLSKTEKSMTELQIEQNLKFDFSMTGEDGKELEPLFGPGLTGLRNLGNSCYLASVLQVLFSLPSFHSRYAEAYRPHTISCPNSTPANCFECQMTKVADGLLSGRYSHPRKVDASVNGEDGPIFQEGLRPSMFKALVGKGHEEFATMRQQDADEFLKHLFSVVSRENATLTKATSDDGAPTTDPTKSFACGLQQRLQCLECHRVRYSVEAQDAGLSLPVPLRVKQTASGEQVKGKDVEGAPTQNPKEVSNATKEQFEEVTIQECLDIFTAAETLDYHCPSCNKSVKATKQTLFTSFPDVLAFQVRRFQLINWVPQKVDVPVLVPIDEDLVLDKYLGTGKRSDEIELPEDSEKKAEIKLTFDTAAMSQLTSMGFPEVRCQRALLATGNTGDAEAAMNWLFSHMEDPDIDDPIDMSAGAMTGQKSSTTPAPDTSMLEEMGFSSAQARKALRLNGNNAEMAVAWLFENSGDAGDDEEMGEASSAPAVKERTIGGNSNLPARYKFKGFISHKGPSVHSGHYVAHIHKPESDRIGERLDQNEDSWVFFNDEKVVRAPKTSPSTRDVDSDVGVKGLSKLAYIYFWERHS